MDVSPPLFHTHNGSAPPKNPNSWKPSSPGPDNHPSRPAAAPPVADSWVTKVRDWIGKVWKRLTLPESLFDAPGAVETPDRIAALDAGVEAAWREEPQRAVASADAEMLASRCRNEIKAIEGERQEVIAELNACPNRVRYEETDSPSLGRDARRWPMVLCVKVIPLAMVLLLLVELLNAIVFAQGSGWVFTEEFAGAALFTFVFVFGPFILFWWGEGSAPPLVKARLIAARRVLSLIVAFVSIVAFGLAVGLEHGEVIPTYGEPEPWSVPLPVLTILSVSMLALMMLAAKSGFEACWNRLRGLTEIDNPRRLELRETLRRLNKALAAPTESLVLANELLKRLRADLDLHKEIARQHLRQAIAEQSAQARRREAERRLRQAQAEMDRESD